VSFSRIFSFLIYFIVISNLSYSQLNEWQWVNPVPTGNNLNDAFTLGDKLMAFGDGGVFLYSIDGGATGFIQYPDSLNGNRSIYEADFVSADTGYICGLSGLLMKTTDGGNTWIHLPSPLTSNYWYLDFIDADTGYVVSSDAKVIKTTDGGQSWSMNTLSAIGTTLYKIYFVSPSTGYLGTGSSTLGRLLKTTDYGATWLPVTSYTSTGTVRGIYFTDQFTGYVTNSSYEILKTTDGGDSWVSQDMGTGTFYEVKFYDRNNGAAAGAAGTVYITSDAGATWTPTSIGFSTYSNVYAIALGNSFARNPSDLFAVGQSGVMAKSTNMGQTWNNISNAVTLNNLRSIRMVNSLTGYACGGSTTESEVIKTTDGGATWSRLTINAGYTLYSQSWIDENTGYVARRGPDGIFKSTDGGLNFTQLNPGQATSTQIWYDMFFADALTGYASSSGGHIVKTTDGGANWTLLPDQHSTSAIYALYMIDAQTLFAAGSGGKVSKTTDGGLSFTAINLTGLTTTLYAVAFNDLNNGLTAGVNGKVFRTTDGGTTWTEYNVGANVTLYDILYVTSSLVWISGDAGMFYSEDGGISWTRANKFHGQNIQYSMSIAGSYLFTSGEYGHILKNNSDPVPVELTSFTASVSGNSVLLSWSTATEVNNSGFEIERSSDQKYWHTLGFINGNGTTAEKQEYYFTDINSLTGTTYYRLKQIDYNGQFEYSAVVAVQSDLIHSFNLEQNYPNPFNPTTSISYQLPYDGLVTVKIYDILGNELQTLVNEYQETGRYNTSFDAGKLASGIYICKIKAGQYTASIKMTLMK
jgi:photosystem II stability/assembly factor-like uncharacterized protein